MNQKIRTIDNGNTFLTVANETGTALLATNLHGNRHTEVRVVARSGDALFSADELRTIAEGLVQLADHVEAQQRVIEAAYEQAVARAPHQNEDELDDIQAAGERVWEQMHYGTLADGTVADPRTRHDPSVEVRYLPTLVGNQMMLDAQLRTKGIQKALVEQQRSS